MRFTEQQKMFQEAVRHVEALGLPCTAVSMHDIEVSETMYVLAINYMETDALLSHYKDSLERQLYTQCIHIKAEFDRRNIIVNIKHR